MLRHWRADIRFPLIIWIGRCCDEMKAIGHSFGARTPMEMPPLLQSSLSLCSARLQYAVGEFGKSSGSYDHTLGPCRLRLLISNARSGSSRQLGLI